MGVLEYYFSYIMATSFVGGQNCGNSLTQVTDNHINTLLSTLQGVDLKKYI
jgi:hypothetical protein